MDDKGLIYVGNGWYTTACMQCQWPSDNKHRSYAQLTAMHAEQCIVQYIGSLTNAMVTLQHCLSHGCISPPDEGALSDCALPASANAGKLPVALLPSVDVLSAPSAESAAMATCFFLGVAAASPDATLGEAGTAIDVWDALVPEVETAAAWLVSGTGGRIERGVAAGVLRGLLGPVGPLGVLRGDVGRLGCSLFTDEPL